MPAILFVGADRKAQKTRYVYVGVNGVARRVKYGYVGVNGVAKRFFGADPLHAYEGPGADFTYGRARLAAAATGGRAIFAGGRNSDGATSACESMDASGTVATLPFLSKGRDQLAAAVTDGGRAIFAGGNQTGPEAVADGYEPTGFTRVDVPALSTARSRLAAGTVRDMTLFIGGWEADTPSRAVDSYDRSLTRSLMTPLRTARGGLGAAMAGPVRLVAAGGELSAQADVYIKKYNMNNMTVTAAPDLSVARGGMACASAGSYAIFAGGSTGSGGVSAAVDAYSDLVTRVSPLPLPAAVTEAAGASAEGENGTLIAFIAGGCGEAGPVAMAVGYDASLTLQLLPDMASARHSMAACRLGDRAIFACGSGYPNPNFASYDARSASDIYKAVQ